MRADAKRGMQRKASGCARWRAREAETIERAAQAEIAAAERAARLELKALAARLAVERAEAVLRGELTPEAEAALFRRVRGGPEREPQLNGALASRYAAALADVALEQKNAEQVKGDLNSFAEALSSSADLRNVLLSPAISREAKQKAIERLAEAMDLAPAVRNFVYLLIDHRRTEMLGEIQQAFESELNARLGIAEAEVTSAQTLSEPERRAVDRGARAAHGQEDSSALPRG